MSIIRLNMNEYDLVSLRGNAFLHLQLLNHLGNTDMGLLLTDSRPRSSMVPKALSLDTVLYLQTPHNTNKHLPTYR